VRHDRDRRPQPDNARTLNAELPVFRDRHLAARVGPDVVCGPEAGGGGGVPVSARAVYGAVLVAVDQHGVPVIHLLVVALLVFLLVLALLPNVNLGSHSSRERVV
jgi:hypothetical protein